MTDKGSRDQEKDASGRYWPTVVARVAEERKQRALADAAPGILAVLKRAVEHSENVWESHEGNCPFQDAMEIERCNCWIAAARALLAERNRR